jgi:hypothetical protein
MDKLLSTLVEIETKYGEVEDTRLANRYEDGCKALRDGTDAEQHYAAVRLQQWIDWKAAQ